LPRSEFAALTEAQTTAHRVCSAREFWIERFGSAAVLSVKEVAQTDGLLKELLRWAADQSLPLTRCYQRLLVRQPREQDTLVPIYGPTDAPTKEEVLENGFRYEVDFANGYSTGLFCDQRHNRRYLHALRPKKTLNTFAYTCAFSVVAASTGSHTLSVDLSKASLQRGRRNFELNGLDLAGHRFLNDDVMDVLARLGKREETFDAIILDPPTFGRSGPRRSFRAERDFEPLLILALACAAPKASLLLSTNCSSLRVEDLRKIASRVTRGKARFHREPPQPDIPSEQAASTLWIHL
jgi:23S rRNA (cytosine1962-C5)-methyltransferase